MADVEEKVLKCRDYLKADLEDNKLLYVIKKLSQLDVTIDILQSTCIGKLVNSFRKRDGSLGEKSKELVNKWKLMVAAEATRLEEDGEDEVSNQNSSSGNEDDESTNENSSLRTGSEEASAMEEDSCNDRSMENDADSSVGKLSSEKHTHHDDRHRKQSHTERRHSNSSRPESKHSSERHSSKDVDVKHIHKHSKHKEHSPDRKHDNKHTTKMEGKTQEVNTVHKHDQSSSNSHNSQRHTTHKSQQSNNKSDSKSHAKKENNHTSVDHKPSKKSSDDMGPSSSSDKSSHVKGAEQNHTTLHADKQATLKHSDGKHQSEDSEISRHKHKENKTSHHESRSEKYNYKSSNDKDEARTSKKSSRNTDNSKEKSRNISVAQTRDGSADINIKDNVHHARASSVDTQSHSASSHSHSNDRHSKSTKHMHISSSKKSGHQNVNSKSHQESSPQHTVTSNIVQASSDSTDRSKTANVVVKEHSSRSKDKHKVVNSGSREHSSNSKEHYTSASSKDKGKYISANEAQKTPTLTDVCKSKAIDKEKHPKSRHVSREGTSSQDPSINTNNKTMSANSRDKHKSSSADSRHSSASIDKCAKIETQSAGNKEHFKDIKEKKKSESTQHMGELPVSAIPQKSTVTYDGHSSPISKVRHEDAEGKSVHSVESRAKQPSFTRNNKRSSSSDSSDSISRTGSSSEQPRGRSLSLGQESKKSPSPANLYEKLAKESQKENIESTKEQCKPESDNRLNVKGKSVPSVESRAKQPSFTRNNKRSSSSESSDSMSHTGSSSEQLRGRSLSLGQESKKSPSPANLYEKLAKESQKEKIESTKEQCKLESDNRLNVKEDSRTIKYIDRYDRKSRYSSDEDTSSDYKRSHNKSRKHKKKKKKKSKHSHLKKKHKHKKSGRRDTYTSDSEFDDSDSDYKGKRRKSRKKSKDKHKHKKHKHMKRDTDTSESSDSDSSSSPERKQRTKSSDKHDKYLKENHGMKDKITNNSSTCSSDRKRKSEQKYSVSKYCSGDSDRHKEDNHSEPKQKTDNEPIVKTVGVHKSSSIHVGEISEESKSKGNYHMSEVSHNIQKSNRSTDIDHEEGTHLKSKHKDADRLSTAKHEDRNKGGTSTYSKINTSSVQAKIGHDTKLTDIERHKDSNSLSRKSESNKNKNDTCNKGDHTLNKDEIVRGEYISKTKKSDKESEHSHRSHSDRKHSESGSHRKHDNSSKSDKHSTDIDCDTGGRRHSTKASTENSKSNCDNIKQHVDPNYKTNSAGSLERKATTEHASTSKESAKHHESDGNRQRSKESEKDKSSSHKTSTKDSSSQSRSHSSKGSSDKLNDKSIKKKHKSDSHKHKHSDDNKSSKPSKKSKTSHSDKDKSFADYLCFDNSDTVSVKQVSPKKSDKVSQKKADEKYEQLKAKFKIKKVSESNTLGLGGKVPGAKRKAQSNDPEEPSPKKMAGADVDFANYLPATQAQYRPWRFGDVAEKPNKSSDMDEMEFMPLKKSSRTQVYSGKKHTVVTEMFSLFDICIKVLQDNIDGLDYVGGIPFMILKPVLEKCTPKQLYDLEDYNPPFLEDSDGLWKVHSEREFKGVERHEMETWRELYLRKFDEREEKLKSIKANISKSMATAVPVRKTQMAYVDNVAKPPREVRIQQARFGTTNMMDTGLAKSGVSSALKQKFQSVDMISLGRAKQAMAERAAKSPMMRKSMNMMRSIPKR